MTIKKNDINKKEKKEISKTNKNIKEKTNTNTKKNTQESKKGIKKDNNLINKIKISKNKDKDLYNVKEVVIVMIFSIGIGFLMCFGIISIFTGKNYFKVTSIILSNFLIISTIFILSGLFSYIMYKILRPKEIVKV